MVQELLLIENPYGRRRHNPVYVAPYISHRRGKRVSVAGHVKNLPGERNPGGGKMSKRNPVGAKVLGKEWLGGMDMMDIGAAAGGLIVASVLPGALVKDATTTTQKIMKVALAFGAAVGAGFVFRNISTSAGKAAVAGGIAGTVVQAIGAFTNWQIGRPSPSPRYLPSPGGRGRGIGESRYEVPGESAGVQVSVT